MTGTGLRCRLFPVIWVAAVAVASGASAQVIRTGPLPVGAIRPAPAESQGEALTFTDLERIRGWYTSYDRELSRRIAVDGWGTLSDNADEKSNVIATRNELHELLRSVSDRRASRNVVLPILIRLRALFETVSTEIYRPETTPAELNTFENRISALTGQRLAGQIDEYYRRFFIKYGENSERLNWLEMLLTEAAFTRAPTGQRVVMPSPWEWIVREQVIGFQYSSQLEKAYPSSPITQIGLTYYLYGDGRLSRLLDHVGVAAAYQRDAITSTNLVGAVLHVHRLDVGFFCPRAKCAHPVFATSVNAQVIRRIF